MARSFNNFENISMGDFVPFEKGYHLLTITGHKEDTKKNAQGLTREVDIFEVMSDTGATTNFTLYYLESTQWTYKKLLHSCGAKVEDMKGNQTLDFDKLIGKRFGAMVEIEEVDKWDEQKGMTVTRRYPRLNASKFYTEEKCIEMMEKEFKSNMKKTDDMVAIDDDGDLPF